MHVFSALLIAAFRARSEFVFERLHADWSRAQAYRQAAVCACVGFSSLFRGREGVSQGQPGDTDGCLLMSVA